MHRRSCLNNMKDATSKELWAAVKPAASRTCRLDCSADAANHYFSMTSYDDIIYSTVPLFDIFTHQCINSPIFQNHQYFNLHSKDDTKFLEPFIIEGMLSILKYSSPGLDSLPC